MKVMCFAGFREYQDVLSEVSVLCEQHDATYVCVLGDLNTDLKRTTPHTNELLEYCAKESLVPLVFHDMSNVVQTFEAACGSVSCIDHVIVSQNLSDDVKSYFSIVDNDNLSDHDPVVAEIGDML